MDHLQKFGSQFKTSLFFILLCNSLLTLAGLWVAYENLGSYRGGDSKLVLLSIAGIITPISAALVTWIASVYLLQPVKFIWEAVMHIAPDTANAAAPDPDKVQLGREFVTILAAHVYQLANVVEDVESASKNVHSNLKSDFVANSLPLPLVVLDKDSNIVFANEALRTYIGQDNSDSAGQNVYAILDLLFSNEDTFDKWLELVKADQITATKTWERVRLDLGEEKGDRYFDLVAYYNKNNPESFEVMLVLFDRTHQYSQDDQAMNLVALAAHELRTPLTLLRGYIDAFEEELEGKLDPEMTDFMRKMKAAGQQLAAFTSTILDVSRFENNQLVLKLREEQLGPLLQSVVASMELRAQVHGIKLTLKVDDNLPSVGVDSLSISEVISNLIDNAIKYSNQGKEIIIHAYAISGGVVETTVQDFGVGVPEAVIGNLFKKFYRDHHNRNQISGTGMGLYLSKAIIDAHGGNIWVKSHEGQGSTFGFTLTPYSQLADEAKKGDTMDITRTPHGWIKNHSLYRR